MQYSRQQRRQTAFQYLQVQNALSQLPTDALTRLIDQGWNLTYPSTENGAAWQKLVSNFLIPSVGASGAIYGILVAFGMGKNNLSISYVHDIIIILCNLYILYHTIFTSHVFISLYAKI